MVLISIDCLRYDTTHSLIKNNKAHNIKKLAEEGIFFEKAISVSPWTGPSITSFLTSTYPLMYNGWLNFSPRTPFINLLRKAGFSTSTCQTNPFISKFFGFDKGFSSFFDSSRESQRVLTRVKRIESLRRMMPSESRFGRFLRLLTLSLSKYLNRYPVPLLVAGELTKANLDLIAKSTRPFFSWLHYMDAHQPHDPYNPDLYTAYKFALIQNKLRINKELSPDEISWLFSWYKDSIVHIDKSIGVLLSKLEEIDITLDNTYFVLTSDHGQEFFEHGKFGHKFRLYDELIHVPLVIAGPEISSGVMPQQVSLIDLPSTILSLLGLRENIPKGYLGRDLGQFLRDSNAQIPNCPAVSEVAIRTQKDEMDARSRILKLDLRLRKISYRFNNWKYVYDESGPDELYNLNKDPNERNNIIEEEKRQAANFLGEIRQHIKMEEKTRKTQKEFLRILNLGRRLRSKI